MKALKQIKIFFVLLIALIAAGCGNGKPVDEDNFPYYEVKADMKTDGQFYVQESVEFPAELWQTPASERFEDRDRGKTEAYFIDSVAGTKVFCFVGIPDGASAANKVPAVVLVHGATGTAFYDWVELWVKRGYAAIAMDTEGRIPATTSTTLNPSFENCQTSFKPHGPHNASFTDSKRPVNQQWVYHAIASIIASTSFIRGFECVDENKVGITGVSYGGFLTCLAVGYDDRFTFAVPVYGCLSNSESASEFGTYINRNEGAAELWDGLGTLKASRTPILFANGQHDPIFSLDSMSRSAGVGKYGAMLIIPRFLHGRKF